MLAYQTTWDVKPRCMGKALEFLKKFVTEARFGASKVRVYTPKIGPNVLVFEATWESVEEHDKWWEEYSPTPEATAKPDEWYELVEKSISTEVWNVTEVT
jgi:hypothetical protein